MLKNRLSVYLSCIILCPICFLLLTSIGFSGEKIIPKQGTWKGTPDVNFEVNSAGEILNFSLSPLIGPSTCTIAVDKIIVGKNG